MKSGRAFIYAVGGVLCVAAGLRLLGGDRGLWIDEYSSLAFATSPNFLKVALRYNTPPLYYLVLRGWSALSSAEPFLRLLSALCSLGSVALIMGTLRAEGRGAVLLGGLLAATLPELLAHGTSLRPYPMLLLATAAVFYFGRRAEYGRLFLSLLFAALVHTVGILLFPAAALFLVSAERTEPRVRRAILALGAGGGALALVFALWFRPHFHAQPWIPPTDWLQGVRVFLGMLIGPKAVEEGHGPAILAGSLLALALAPLGDWRRSFPYFAAAVAVWAQLVVISLFLRPILLDRTAVMALVPLVLFTAVQATSLTGRCRAAAVAALGLLCLAFAAEWALREAYIPKENWKAVFRKLNRLRREDDALILVPRWLANEGIGTFHYPVPPRRLLALDARADSRESDRRWLTDFVARYRAEHPSGPIFLISHHRVPDGILTDGLGERTLLVEGPVKLFLFRP